MLPCSCRRVPLSLAVAAGLLLAQPVLAETPGVCPEPRPVLKRAEQPAELPTHVRADEADSVQDGRSEFSGNVEMTHGQSRLRADQVTYDSGTDITEARGNVVLDNETGDSYRTQYLTMHGETRRGHATAGSYTLQSNDARGDMQRVDFLDRDHTKLTQVRYTTCAPGQDDWFVYAPEIQIDNIEEMGYVRNARVEFKGVPIFYMPRGAFSISDKRKSGFLTPSFGYTSNSGADVTVPYYFNLAPNYDDTLTPRFLASRGLQLQNEFRYITRHSEGKLDLEVLPNDQVRNIDRYSAKYIHSHTFNPLWSANVDLRGVSDKDYLSDFGTTLGTTSLTHLPQNAEVNYRGSIWSFAGRVSDHQTVDRTITPENRPYARIPQLVLTANTPTVSERPQYYFGSELVRFHRSGASVTGNRLNLTPAVSYPVIRSYGFLTPKIGMRYIGYNLSGTSNTSPSVARGFLSLDSGLFFDREVVWLKREYTHTLEPRLHFLYVPYKDQDQLPNFDTGAPDLSFANFFRDQRFDGGDRVGDTKQITLALTTRVLDAADGVERMRGSLGRVYYLADRKVNITPGTVTLGSSDILAEASARFVNNWFATAGAQLDRDTHKTQKSSVYLQYNPARDKIANFGQRFTRNESIQRDVSFEWPLVARWTLRARALDSLRPDDREIESYVGIGYNACCWAFRVMITRRYVQGDAITRNHHIKAIMFELELTGLAKQSRGGEFPDSPLKQSVFTSYPEDRWTPRGLQR